ncbi:MAG: TIGR02757 family protein [Bacteroidaceae bacterium]|nr:TIGR02757 family protein [Bacteroidaceae bacterium]
MDTTLKQRLAALAARYNTPDFIPTDPVQFPHRYADKRDIEVSAFVTAWISWGNRKQIVKTAEKIDTEIFRGQPLKYLMSYDWCRYSGDTRCFYRTVRYHDFFLLMERLHTIYTHFPDLEAAVVHELEMRNEKLEIACALSSLFRDISGIADARKGSPCKRLWFFLRWMVRRDGIVDFGIWRTIDPTDLIIPLDTHVYNMARAMGLTARRTADSRTAREITDQLRQVFPHDPVLGDFALFGYGIEHG